MASREKEVAALSAVIAYFAMNASINAMLLNTGKILEDGSIAEDVLSGTIASSVGIQTPVSYTHLVYKRNGNGGTGKCRIIGCL